ncbi:MAG TPA: class I SAM-dependent methyltransferase [Terracidiphilus sp.]|nr:class I SAM-dependent methyltransferase [Terracidiphilus sp.]
MSASLPLLSSKAQEGGAPDFDGLARAYRWIEYLSFGPMLSRCRTEFIRRLSHCRSALVIGDGDGRFTARLLATNPLIHIDAIDASPEMLRALVRRAGNDALRVRAEVHDARAWTPNHDAHYDLVVTHFFLDCLTTAEIESLAQRIAAVSAPGALWVISEFAIPESWFGRFIARPLIAALYCAFGLLTGLHICNLPDHHTALAAAGFRPVARRTRLSGLLESELLVRASCERR